MCIISRDSSFITGLARTDTYVFVLFSVVIYASALLFLVLLYHVVEPLNKLYSKANFLDLVSVGERTQVMKTTLKRVLGIYTTYLLAGICLAYVMFVVLDDGLFKDKFKFR